jgi:hypothetical protein
MNGGSESDNDDVGVGVGVNGGMHYETLEQLRRAGEVRDVAYDSSLDGESD